MCAIAAQVLQSHLYFYFLTFGRSEQVLGQSISKENIKLWDDSGDNYRESAVLGNPLGVVKLKDAGNQLGTKITLIARIAWHLSISV